MRATNDTQTFDCRSTCKHKQCQHLGRVSLNQQENGQGMVNTPTADAQSIFLENILDMAHTLAQVMIICGIHECKARATANVTTYAFLHYEQVCYCFQIKPRKMLRKEELIQDLGVKCKMDRVEAHLAYAIIKRGFKAFYGEIPESPYEYDGEPQRYPEECLYVYAARKTVESFARNEGFPCTEQLRYQSKVMLAYRKFYDRMKMRQTPLTKKCPCCVCTKKCELPGNGEGQPCGLSEKLANGEHKCPECCKKLKIIHPGQRQEKCPNCQHFKRFCICHKYKFGLDWVKSIWERPDWAEYYAQNIDMDLERKPRTLCDGNSWFDL